MTMRPTSLALAGATLLISFPVSAFGQSDVVKGNPKDIVKVAEDVERTYRSFKMVSLEGNYRIQCPFPLDPSGIGRGGGTLASYFWSPTRFQIDYLVFSTHASKRGYPDDEWIIFDEKGHDRVGAEVGPNTKFSPKSGLFDISTDAALVEAWPSRFPKLINSSFVGGNATLSRYVKALVRGVGGYHLVLTRRTLRIDARNVPQVILNATRQKSARYAASTVAMTFNVGVPTLPVEIRTTYGSITKIEWNGSWKNNQPAWAMPKTPHTIGPVGKKH